MYSRLRSSLHWTLTGLLLLLLSESGAAREDIVKLADMLDASGRLDVPAGFSGQVDVAGYRLRLTDDGHPRLVSDADWGDEFGLDRGCDGNVLAAAVGSEGEVYFGGWFNYCDEVRANNIVRYDPATDAWLPLGDIGNGVNGAVLALSYADGVLYAGGSFTEVDGGFLANHVAAWDTTTAQWRTFGQGTNGVVRAITVSPQGDLFVGGSFSEVTTSAAIVASNVARWNNTSQSWSALEGVGGQGVDGLVYALNWLNGNLYVGGQFTEVNVGAPQSVLALAIWSQLGGWSSLGGQASVQGNVYALANDGTDLFVGGNLFAVSQPNGDQLETRGIARWSPASAHWTGLGEPILTPIDLGGSVRSITIVGGSLVIGGSFYGLTHPDRMRSLARWDLVGESWSSLDGLLGTGAIGDVFVVAGVGDNIYVGGNYRQTREQGTQINRGSVTRWDLSMGVASTLASATGGAAHGDVGAVAFVDGDMYVTGVSSVGGEIAHGIARWDGQSWDLLDTDASTISGGSLAVLDGEIYVGGDSMSLPGIPVARGVARWTPATRTWSLLGNAQANGVDGVVLALTVHNGKLIVGGLFEHANFDVSSGGSSIRADNIASWDPQTQQWAALASSSGQGLDNLVYTLHAKDDELYVGGLFVQANLGAPITVNRIARWDGSQWSALGTDGGIGLNGGVVAISSSRTHLYVAGTNLTEANVGAPVATPGVARWNLSEGGWSGLGNGIVREPGDYILALAAADGGVYVAGRFGEVNTPDAVAVSNIARWDENTEHWSSPGSGIIGNWVNELTVRNDRVYVGGYFRMAADKSSIGVAHFSATTRVFADGFE